MTTITIPDHIGQYLGQWIREYDAAVARPPVTDPEGHEQSLMESSRLLGTAGALLRLIDAIAAADPWAPAPPAAAAADPYANHRAAVDALASVPGSPASRGLASCGHPANSDGECNCSSWPERAPDAGQDQFDAFAETARDFRP